MEKMQEQRDISRLRKALNSFSIVSKIFFNWWKIVLPFCVGFCHTMQISHNYWIYVYICPSLLLALPPWIALVKKSLTVLHMFPTQHYASIVMFIKILKYRPGCAFLSYYLCCKGVSHTTCIRLRLGVRRGVVANCEGMSCSELVM